jgi:hypothetical protein
VIGDFAATEGVAVDEVNVVTGGFVVAGDFVATEGVAVGEFVIVTGNFVATKGVVVTGGFIVSEGATGAEDVAVTSSTSHTLSFCIVNVKLLYHSLSINYNLHLSSLLMMVSTFVQQRCSIK